MYAGTLEFFSPMDFWGCSLLLCELSGRDKCFSCILSSQNTEGKNDLCLLLPLATAGHNNLLLLFTPFSTWWQMHLILTQCAALHFILWLQHVTHPHTSALCSLPVDPFVCADVTSCRMKSEAVIVRGQPLHLSCIFCCGTFPSNYDPIIVCCVLWAPPRPQQRQASRRCKELRRNLNKVISAESFDPLLLFLLEVSMK